MSVTLSKDHKPGIAIETYYSPEFICKLQDVAKRIPQLKKTGENFRIWEKQLKIMIGNLTGASDYLLQELHKHDPKLNRAVFDLIMWSIDDELLEHCNIDGSAGDAFQALAGRFRSNSSAQCIINCPDFPEEILDNIVNIVYQQSAEEHNSIKERRSERRGYYPKKGMRLRVYAGHGGPPVLNTIQNLAVVNRKFYRLCLPRLWQKLRLPSSLPAPMSLWTDDLLLKHGNLVKWAKIKMEDLYVHQAGHECPEADRSFYDNTSSDINGSDYRFGVGLLNIVKIFKVCPYLESVIVYLPPNGPVSYWMSDITARLEGVFQFLPRLQHLKLHNPGFCGLSGDFIIDIIKKLPSLTSLKLYGFGFVRKESEEESLGWNLAQLQNLRKLSLHSIKCADQTWTLKSWAEPLTHLELDDCEGLTPKIEHELLSGRTPFLTKLKVEFFELDDEDVDVRFDFPALKTLILILCETPDVLVSFENCKSIEIIEYHGKLYEFHWVSMENHLSRRTWPKLSVLDLRESTFHDDFGGWIGEEDLDEIEEKLKAFNIKVLMKK